MKQPKFKTGDFVYVITKSGGSNFCGIFYRLIKRQIFSLIQNENEDWIYYFGPITDCKTILDLPLNEKFLFKTQKEAEEYYRNNIDQLYYNETYTTTFKERSEQLLTELFYDYYYETTRNT